MLKVTDRAASLLKVAKSMEGAPDAGIRIRQGIDSTDRSVGVGFSISDQPEDGDAELEHNGLRIFVEESLIDRLDDKTLDVRDAEEGPLLIFH